MAQQLAHTAALLLLYLGLVSVGGYLLGRAAETLLGRVHARLVGGVLLGFIVTLPEYLFAVISTTTHHNDVAIGSAFGGNILLFTLPFGLLLLSSGNQNRRPLEYGGIVFDVAVLGVSTALILAWSVLRLFDTAVGAALIALYVAFIAYSARLGGGDNQAGPGLHTRAKVASATMFVVGLVLVVLAIHPLVDEVVDFSIQVGVPPVITSFTLVPLGDELPELVAMVTLLASKKRGAETEGGKAAYANLIGSKVQSNTLLVGTIILVAAILEDPMVLADRYTLFTLYAMVATTIMGIVAVLTRASRGFGAALVASYVAILALAFFVEI